MCSIEDLVAIHMEIISITNRRRVVEDNYRYNGVMERRGMIYAPTTGWLRQYAKYSQICDYVIAERRHWINFLDVLQQGLSGDDFTVIMSPQNHIETNTNHTVGLFTEKWVK